MPLYEYECTVCGHRVERIEKVSGPHLGECPKCGGKVERILAPPAIQFKGSGWYVTDYARKGSSQKAKGEKPEGKEPQKSKEPTAKDSTPTPPATKED